MAGNVKISGAWKETDTVHAKVGGAWKTVENGYTKISGVWKEWYSAVTPHWINNITAGINSTYSQMVAVDNSNNIYLTSPSGNIVKFDSNSKLLWNKSLSDSVSGTSNIQSSKIDSSGNLIVLAGSGMTLTVTKIDGTGTVLMHKKITYSNQISYVSTYKIFLDSSNNIYITMNGNRVSNSSAFDGFVTKLNSSGAVQWNRYLTGPTYGCWLEYLSFDSSGNVYATGAYKTGLNSTRILLWKINVNGDLTWRRQIYRSSGDAFDIGGGIVNDGTHIYFTSRASSIGTFVFKYDFNGNLVFQRQILRGGNEEHQVGQVELYGGNLYLSAFSTYAFLYKYDTSGVLQWQRRLQSSAGSMFGNTLAVKNDKIYTAGAPATSVRSFPIDGSKTGAYVVGSTTFTYGPDTSTDQAASLSSANESTVSYSGQTATVADATASIVNASALTMDFKKL